MTHRTVPIGADRGAGAAADTADGALCALLSISRASIASRDPEEVFAALAAETARLLDVDGVLVLARDNEGPTARIAASYGFPLHDRDCVFTIDESGKPAGLDNLGEPHGWLHLAASPLTVKDRAHGFLCAYSASADAGGKRAALLELLAALAAEAYGNALLCQHTARGSETLAEVFKVVSSQVSTGLIFLDEHRRIVLINQAAVQLVGLTEMPVGLSFGRMLQAGALIFPTSSGARVLDRILPGQGFTSLTVHAGRTQRDLELEAQGIADKAGRPAGTVVFLRDLSGEETDAKESVAFLSTAVHELRAPLATIDSYVQLIQHPDYQKRPGQLERACDAIARNTAQMSQICKRLLDLSRLMAGRFQLNLVETDLALVVANVTTEMRTLFSEKGVELRLDLGHAMLWADPLRLHEMVANLVGKALKFSRSGAKVNLRTWSEAGAAGFSVRDEGPGIPPDKLGDVFNPYYREDNIPKEDGLGLVITKGIVEAHGGSITVWSKPGAGALFTVRLPVGRQQ